MICIPLLRVAWEYLYYILLLRYVLRISEGAGVAGDVRGIEQIGAMFAWAP
jgi:hypothetical protein